MPHVIDRFRAEYAFLSNFCRSPFKLEGLSYDNVEQYFQSKKTPDLVEATRIRQASARDARGLGQHCQLVSNWGAIKDEVMRKAVWAKFEQNPELAELLLRTGDSQLIEGNTWHDTYWGVCYCPRHGGEGLNRLGQILMEVRTGLVMSRQGGCDGKDPGPG